MARFAVMFIQIDERDGEEKFPFCSMALPCSHDYALVRDSRRNQPPRSQHWPRKSYSLSSQLGSAGAPFFVSHYARSSFN